MTEEEDAFGPLLEICLTVSESGAGLHSTVWPFRHSNYHLVGDKDLSTVFQDFIEDNSIPGGTATPDHRAALLKAFAQVQQALDKAVAQVNGLQYPALPVS